MAREPETIAAVDERRLYLVTPVLAEAERFLPALEAALDAGDVACVLLRLATANEADAKRIVRALARPVQARGAALLVEGDVRLAVRAEADGVHIHGSGEALERALEEAVASMKPERIVGAGGLASRHDAMSAGEKEIDYVMFGGGGVDGRGMPFETVVERVAWWAEIFNIPCVGFAATLDDMAELVEAGADFVALGDAVWTDPRGAAAAVRDADAALRPATSAS
jgi:thiamine-phosphate pyrophosphorylase